MVGLLANLVAIPWVSLVVMPVLVAGGLLAAVVPGTAQLFLPIFDLTLGVLWQWLMWLAQWQAQDIRAGVPELLR